jgi:hypothetical protein
VAYGAFMAKLNALAQKEAGLLKLL